MTEPPETHGDGVDEDAPRCIACGRLLRDQESRRLRLGPVCRERLRGLLAPRPRLIGTPTATTHPSAVPARATTQLAFETWDEDDQDDEPDPYRPRPITDVPTGALL